MADGYIHGAYAEQSDSVVSAAATATNAPLIIGTAPVNLIRGYASLVNTPIKLTDIGAKKVIGYSDDWENFTLCEAISAFFDNSLGNVGPIYVVNVLNPDVHKASTATSVTLSFTNGRAYIESDTIIIDTLALEGLVEGTDYELNYNFTTGKLAITSADSANLITGTVAATYYDVDASAVTDDDIIGDATAAGVYTGMHCGDLLYPNFSAVPNLVLAPTWSEHPDVYKAMCEYVQGINSVWYSFVLADIPVVDSANSDAVVDTIEIAKTWQTTNGYDSMYSKVFWPQAVDKSGTVYHLATLAAAEMIRTDETHDGVPMETPSNKTSGMYAQYFGPSSSNQGFDKETGNQLNAVGITTLIAWAGTLKLWGPHTAAFEAGDDGNAIADVDPLGIFDVNMRMQEYIMNSFVADHGDDVDEPMSRALKDQIINAEQEKLDALVAQGALIGSPTISFLESENSTTDMINGNFVWNISSTPTPPAKSLTAKVAYTDAGFDAYFGEEE